MVIDSDIECYLREISRFELLTLEEEQVLAGRIAKGDVEARERMIRSNLRLVVNIAKNYVNYGLPLLDLVAEGNFGLLKAAERFRPGEGASFSTYASWWIKQAIRRAINTKLKNVRVPAYMADIVSRWRHVSNELSQGLERNATPDEIARAMRLNPEKIAIVQKAIGADTSSSFGRRATGFMRRAAESDTSIIEELPARPGQDMTSDGFLVDEDAKKIESLLSCLTAREQKVLRLRYGFGVDSYLTLQAIGKRLKITRERVRQIEAIAIKKLFRVLGEEP
ncbi:MAG: RNA polymerase sigma factor RpoD/SigA [Planctomycetota bacterium]